ncbi:MAG: FG-GAP-like repeat-containing protein, partial [Planctomycetota bacterium]
LWVNTNEEIRNQNLLWQNQLRETGSATFIYVTDVVGLEVTVPSRTFHSSWSDFDQDGDMDLFENNFRSQNRLMKNMLVETGSATFIDNTASASLPGENLGYPRTSFGSAVADFNGDGFDDIFANFRFRSIPGDEPVESPYGNGHAIFLNDGTVKLKNATSDTIKSAFPPEGGVMGFMVGDLNGDNLPEIFLGQGGPMIRQENQLWVTTGVLDANGFPVYQDASDSINFPAPESNKYSNDYYPKYPYRTHGSTFVDTNNDGSLEIHVANGGRAADDNSVRDPNRHFLFDWGPQNYFVVRLIGNGIDVNRDGLGARLQLTVGSMNSQEKRVLYRTVRGGNAFSAQNNIRAIHFGLGSSDFIESLRIIWPDGKIQFYENSLQINSFRSFAYDILLGDINLDGAVNLLDIAPFTEILSAGGFQVEADMNQDGTTNLLDVEPFISALNN